MVCSVNIVDITEIEVSVDDSEVLWIVDDRDIVRVKFGPCEDRAVNLIPILYPFGHLRMIALELSALFVKLSKESSPSKDDSFVFHPSELHKL